MSETESLVSKLHSLGFKATYYHGGLTSRERIKHAALDGR
jgi:superfamily II DNA helicase RecQ